MVDGNHVQDATFRRPFAEMLAKLDAEAPHDALPIATKAGTKSYEIRDTTSPHFITEMVMGILRGIGGPVDIPRIHKHTREEVLWSDTLKPWRRSPLWLFVRCVLQTTTMRDGKAEDGYKIFKSVMIFLMARILERSLAALFPSDLLFCMKTKLVRRLLKLNPPSEAPWIIYVRQVVQRTAAELKHRWERIENNPDPFHILQEWKPAVLSFSYDTALKLSRLKSHLQKINFGEITMHSPQGHPVESSLRITRNPSRLPNITSFRHITDEAQKRLLLTDIEAWTSNCLVSWQAVNMGRSDACVELADTIETYVSAAMDTCKGDPESLSTIFLTAIDLWVSMDRIATYRYPILLDYKTEFPSGLFDPLLLSKRRQMERLVAVENHLTMRNARAKPGYPPVFNSEDINCLASRFYDQSIKHQSSLHAIEQSANVARGRKRSELASKSQEYKRLIEQANSMDCSYKTKKIFDRAKRIMRDSRNHDPKCQRCKLKSQAGSLSIECHEWPLPRDNLAKKVVIFELDVPLPVSKWRDTTYSLLVDVFTASRSESAFGGKNKKQYYLLEYNGLTPYSISRKSQRLQLASATKPFTVSHYRSKKVSAATEETICVDNGLKFEFYDFPTQKPARTLMGHYDVRTLCALKLPTGPYHSLQFALTDTIHTSNMIVAQQSTCPSDVTIHEFLAFGHLRAGHRLQWQNIARNLVDGGLDFNREEIHLLLAQAAWQAGPAAKPWSLQVNRDSHGCLEEASFCKDILRALGKNLTFVEMNWQGATAVRTMVVLATRLLSLSVNDEVHQESFDFLGKARQVAFRWTSELSKKLADCENEEQLKAWTNSTLEVALTCHGTFDVDEQYLPRLLDSKQNLAILVECSIIVHDLSPATTSGLPKTTQRLMRRFSTLLHRMESALFENIFHDSQELDRSIRRRFSSYQPVGRWTSFRNPASEWLTTKTSNVDAEELTVHYNVLNGSLLINGNPLTRLPRSYESHESYKRLFGTVCRSTPLLLNYKALLTSSTESPQRGTASNERYDV